MSWLESADRAIFRFINLDLSNPVFDTVMPWFSSNPFFVPVVLFIAIGLLWKGGSRGRTFVILLALILALGDSFVINTLKHALGRMRPFYDVGDVHLLVGRGSSGSMPSSHTSTWFAALLLTYVFYPGSWRFMLPLALGVAFSRIYVGAHYPSDVLAGAILGAGYAAAGLLAVNWFWQQAGRKCFPEWWERLPSFAPFVTDPKAVEPRPAAGNHWLRLGYLLIVMLTVGRLLYLASDTIQLSEDEAYQWLWSKHLALSYYSKPPMIAYLQFAGTTLWGDNEFGVRFLSPIIAGLLSLLMLRFFARNVDERAGFWLVIIINCTPLLAVGATLMTVDPPLVLFWTCAMVAGWRAIQSDATTKHWAWVGLWMGLGFLSKYSALFQVVCWAIFLVLWPPARMHLKRLGPWLALLITALCTLPVIIWNAQHSWVTVEHVAYNAGRTSAWKPTLRFFFEFMGSEAGLMNPVFFVAALWAMVAFWRRWRRDPLLLFLFSMGAPVFIGYLLFTGYKRVFPNWIAPAVLPMLCVALVYWYRRWQEGLRSPRGWLATGVAVGCAAVALLHNTALTKKVMDRTLPPSIDPLRRVRAWGETARVVETAREQLEAEGKPAFVIANHYGMAGELSFYIPEARKAVRSTPLVYYKSAEQPKNQFYFWPGYGEQRAGQNAILVKEVDLPPLQRDWIWKWLAGEKELYATKRPERSRPTPEVVKQFESVRDLGVFDIKYRGRIFRRVQLFACRNLRN